MPTLYRGIHHVNLLFWEAQIQRTGFPCGSFPCRHPACSRQEGQAECQHANAPPRQVPGRVVIAHRIAPRLPSQHCGQCRHHQGGLTPVPSLWVVGMNTLNNGRFRTIACQPPENGYSPTMKPSFWAMLFSFHLGTSAKPQNCAFSTANWMVSNSNTTAAELRAEAEKGDAAAQT